MTLCDFGKSKFYEYTEGQKPRLFLVANLWREITRAFEQLFVP
jgi:hypothetical protein